MLRHTEVLELAGDKLAREDGAVVLDGPKDGAPLAIAPGVTRRLGSPEVEAPVVQRLLPAIPEPAVDRDQRRAVVVGAGRDGADAAGHPVGAVVEHAGHPEARDADDVVVAHVAEEGAEAAGVFHALDRLDLDEAPREGIADDEVREEVAALAGEEQEAAVAVDELPGAAAGAAGEEVQGEVPGLDGRRRGRDC